MTAGRRTILEAAMRQALLSFVIALLACSAAHAGADTLTVSFGDTQQTYTAAALLARPDAATITIADDVSYKRPMTYRAVPLLALLGGKPILPSTRSKRAQPTASSRRSPCRWWRRARTAAASPGWPSRTRRSPGRRCRARMCRPARSISSGSTRSARRSAPSCGRTRPSPSPASNRRRTAGRRWPLTRRCRPTIRRGRGRACSPRNACRAIA